MFRFVKVIKFTKYSLITQLNIKNYLLPQTQLQYLAKAQTYI